MERAQPAQATVVVPGNNSGEISAAIQNFRQHAFSADMNNMAMNEYKPGDIVPQSSPLYRVLHDPPREGEQLQTFYRGERFPPCPDCGRNVRYLPPNKSSKNLN